MTNILICSNGSEPLNEMASMPTYGKHSSQSQESFELNLLYTASGTLGQPSLFK